MISALMLASVVGRIGAAAYDDLVRVFGSVGGKPLRRDRCWDKDDRNLTRVLLPCADPPRC